MVKKETIGKVQLTIGIIILLLAITGLISSYVLFNQSLGPRALPVVNENSTNLEIIRYYSMTNMQTSSIIGAWELITTLAVGSLIVLILSLLFITQGLVNIGEKKRVPFLRK